MSPPDVYGPPRDADELARLVELQAVAFNLSAEYCRQWSDDAGHDRLRVWRDGDAVVGCAGIHPFGQWFGGRCVPMAGIDGVGIDPGHRGRGHARGLMVAVLEECRRRGLCISTLWPSTDVPYQRVGYAQAGVGMRWRMPLDDLPAVAGAGAMRRFTEADRPAVESAYRRWAARQNGQADRDGFLWNKAFRRGSREAVGWLHEGDAGVEAFCTLHQERTPTGTLDLDMLDLWFTSPAGAQALLAFCRGHRSLARHLVCEAGPADPLWVWLQNPSNQVQRCTWWMVRIVDVPAALSARGYPSELRGELHLRVRDPLLSANDGAWVLHVAEGRGGVEAGGRGDLELDVADLAPLFSSHLSASQLQRRGACQGEPAILTLADAVFGGPTPWMADGF